MNDVTDDVKNILNQINTLNETMEKLKSTNKKSNSAETQLGEPFKVPTIKCSELQDPESDPGNVRGSGSVVKRVFRGAITVACKKVLSLERNTEAEFQRTQKELAILNLLGKCPNIITFHGVSEIDQSDCMVLEWAEYGNLREVCSNFEIPWNTKLKFASDIFTGLYYILNSGILHHDVRCENVLVSINDNMVFNLLNFLINLSNLLMYILSFIDH